MAINPIQLPKWEQAPTVDWKPLDAIGDSIAYNRRRTAEGEAFGGLVDAIPDRPERAPGAPPPGQPGRELPRGLRNNNPGNIEDGPTAKGLPGYKGSDGRFAIFDTPENGLGAMDHLLTSYGRRGLKTVKDVVSRWAPKGDGANDPDAYARFVSSSGDPNEPVDLTDQAQRKRLIGKMAMFENGMQAGAPREGEAAPGGVAPAAAEAYGRGMTPEMKERVRALFRVGTPGAVQAAMALTQKYLGKQEPLIAPAGSEVLDPNQIDPATGLLRVIGRGQPRVASQPKEKTYAELVAERIKQAQAQGMKPDDPATQKFVLTGQIDKDSDSSAEKFEGLVKTRTEQAKAAGIDPRSSEGRQFILTGSLPKVDDKVPATDRKAVQDAEDDNAKLESTISGINRAKELNSQIFTGWTASARGNIGTSGLPGAGFIFDKGASEATNEWDQIMSAEGIKAMSETLKGASTDYEMRKFLAIAADTSKTPKVREAAMNRLLEFAQRKQEINKTRMDQLRQGIYYKPGGGQSRVAPGTGPSPETTDKAALIEQARDAIAKGADPAAVAERLRSMGVPTDGLQ